MRISLASLSGRARMFTRLRVLRGALNWRRRQHCCSSQRDPASPKQSTPNRVTNVDSACSQLDNDLMSGLRCRCIGCICLTFLHCVFSCVSLKCLRQRIHSHIGCICLQGFPRTSSGGGGGVAAMSSPFLSPPTRAALQLLELISL